MLYNIVLVVNTAIIVRVVLLHVLNETLKKEQCGHGYLGIIVKRPFDMLESHV